LIPAHAVRPALGWGAGCPRTRSRCGHNRTAGDPRRFGGLEDQSPGASIVLVSRLRPCPAPRRASRATPWTTACPTPGQSDTRDDARGQDARQPGARRPSRAERPRLPL